jgi:hypothetical protein
MANNRKLIRLKVSDFLEIRPLNEVAKCFRAKACDVTPMGICFNCEMEWKRGHVLMIDYFIPEEFESIKLKVAIVWSEFIDTEKGYFCGGEIIEVESGKQEKFTSYYTKRLKETSL